MFTRRIAASARPAGTSAARQMTDRERAGVTAAGATALATGRPMLAAIVGLGTLVCYGMFSRNDDRRPVL
jgi:hypothetical protein